MRQDHLPPFLKPQTYFLCYYASKVMLKFIQGRFQQYVNRELPDVQAGIRKGRGTRDQDQDNHDDVIAHLEPDILEWEVKWALKSITENKASGGDGIPVELFQILKVDAVKVLHSICQQLWKTQQGSQDWKRSVFIPIPKKGNARECSNYHTIALISRTSKIILKILQARL